MRDNVLETWFEENKRDFPWRIDRTPYRVWIAEVMLQQTRASVVVPYFLRWMELFPDIHALYNAPIEKVIKAWEGLGYYSRARNIHNAAKEIVEKFGGIIPNSEQELLSIRGFGPYTVGAIRSFAFQQRAAAVDGNVMRVISRFFCIEGEIGKSATKKKISEKTERFLHPDTPWITSEALIELGATICTPKPRCLDCPLKQRCLANKQNRAQYLPMKKKDQEAIHIHRVVFIFESEGSILVRKGEKGKVMEDLYEFPYIEIHHHLEFFLHEANQLMTPLQPCSHTFTKYKANLYPYLTKTDRFESRNEWIEIKWLNELPFSSGHRKILTALEKVYNI